MGKKSKKAIVYLFWSIICVSMVFYFRFYSKTDFDSSEMPKEFREEYLELQNEGVLKEKLGEEVNPDLYLLQWEISESRLKWLVEKGFTPIRITYMFHILKSDKEKEMFQNLIQGEYAAAFQKEPSTFSKEAKYIMLNYTNTLLQKDEMEEMEKLINGILYTDETHSWYPNVSHKNAYGPEYMKMMYETSLLLLNGEAKSLIERALPPTEEEENELYEEMKFLADTNALWGALKEVPFGNEYLKESGADKKNNEILSGCRIQDLKLGFWGFSFKSEYQSAQVSMWDRGLLFSGVKECRWHNDNLLEVSTSMYNGKENIRSYLYFRTISALENGIKIDSDLHCLKVLDGDSGMVLEDSMKALKEYLREGKDAETEAWGDLMKIEGFGALTAFETENTRKMISIGYCDAKYILKLKKWERDGLRNMLQKRVSGEENKTNADEIIEAIRNVLGNEMTDEEKIILYGGDIFGMNYDVFERSMKAVENAYANLKFEGGNRKLYIWSMFLYE